MNDPSTLEAQNERTNRFLRRIGAAALIVLLLFVPTSIVLQVQANRKADRGRARIGGLVQDVHDCTTPLDAGNPCQLRQAPAQARVLSDLHDDQVRIAVAAVRCATAPDPEACVRAATTPTTRPGGR